MLECKINNDCFSYGYHTTSRYINIELSFLAMHKYRDLIPEGKNLASIAIIRDGKCNVYYSKKFQQTCTGAAEEWFTDPDLWTRFLNSANKHIQAVNEFTNKIKKIDFDTLEVSMVYDLFEQNCSLLKKLYAHYESTSERQTDFIKDKILLWLQGKTFAPIDILDCLLSFDVSDIASVREMFEWHHLANLLSEGDISSSEKERRLRRHSEEFGFLGVRRGNSQGWNVEELKARLLQGQAYTDIESTIRSGLIRMKNADFLSEECASRIHLPRDMFHMCRSIASAGACRLKMREASAQNARARNDLMNRIYKIVESHSDGALSWDMVRQLSFDDIRGVLRDRKILNSQILKSRVQCGLIYLSKQDMTQMAGDDAETVVQQIESSTVVRESSQVLRGISIREVGVLEGTAVVIEYGDTLIKTKSQCKDLIIVSNMIRPDLILTCMFVKAIIVEEGGMVSHAALVAREFGIPCIVSVHGAMTHIQNDDRLSIDTAIGEIRFLETPDKIEA